MEKVFIKGRNQEKRGRSRDCKVQEAGGLGPPVHPLFKSYILFELLLSSILSIPPQPRPRPFSKTLSPKIH